MSINFLRNIVSVPSYSTQEKEVADFICSWLDNNGIFHERRDNNILLHKSSGVPGAPSILLNSHIDTVKASPQYSFDPFNPPLSRDKICGLGSNDAGGCFTAMLFAYIELLKEDLPFNLGLILSAEEECSGPKGVSSLSQMISERYDFAIVGEPTNMRGAIGERGLLVIDGLAKGVTGHAARNEGINAIDIAIDDIQRIKDVRFDRVSPTMGNIKLSVTQINAGTQHNVIPGTCSFVIDIRMTEQYTPTEVLEMLQSVSKSELKARRLTNKSSATPLDHILIQALDECNIEKFISPTTSDWMKIEIPAIKMGPGDSARSHQADEFIYIDELENGIKGYIKYLKKLGEIINNGK